MLDVAQLAPDTEAEGPGRRFAIWVQGCPLRCPDCCNPQMLPDAGAPGAGPSRRIAPAALARRILRQPAIEGISLLGGEPFAQAAGLAEVARAVRARGLTVMIYSGLRLDALRASADPGVAALLAACDLLVDGPYRRELPETTRRWIGSRNQLMHFLGDAYAPDDPRLTAPNTVEIRLVDGELVVNGWPALARAVRRGKVHA